MTLREFLDIKPVLHNNLWVNFYDKTSGVRILEIPCGTEILILDDLLDSVIEDVHVAVDSEGKDSPAIVIVLEGFPNSQRWLLNETQLREVIVQALNNEQYYVDRCHSTKPGVDFIKTALTVAYASGFSYDISDLKPAVLRFTEGSVWCSKHLAMIDALHFKSKDREIALTGVSLAELLDMLDPATELHIYYDENDSEAKVSLSAFKAQILLREEVLEAPVELIEPIGSCRLALTLGGLATDSLDDR